MILFILKKDCIRLAVYAKVRIFAPEIKNDGSLAQLNRAFDYGSKGYRFESCRSHTKRHRLNKAVSFLYEEQQGPHPIDIGSPDKSRGLTHKV